MTLEAKCYSVSSLSLLLVSLHPASPCCSPCWPHQEAATQSVCVFVESPRSAKGAEFLGWGEIMSSVSLMDVENPSRLVRFPMNYASGIKSCCRLHITESSTAFVLVAAVRLFMAAPPRSFRKPRPQVPLINIY